MLSKPIAQPKPPPRVKDRITKQRERDNRAAQFRDAVWRRDGYTCQRCERKVRRTLEMVPEQGHVDHLRGRNVAPEDRYRVDAARLLCRDCHDKRHSGRGTPKGETR